MGDILTYVDASRNRSFGELPFSEVDSLILSQVSYCDFSDSPFGAERFTASLADWFREEGSRRTLRGMMTADHIHVLMNMLSYGGRHGDLKAGNYVSIMDLAHTKQFSAITFEIEPGVYYIAFRGTDNSVVGWKEDMALYYLPEIPAQKAAREYAMEVMSRLPGKFYLGGHSKGGNLAIYTATHLSPELQERLITVYDHDGPGFPEAFYRKEGYQAISSKIHKTLPRSSVIGLLLEDGAGYHVVDSSAEGLMQHDAFTWQLDGDRFSYLPEVDDFALHVDQALTQWTEEMDLETRKKLVDLIFDIIFSTGIEVFAQMQDDTVQHVKTMMAGLKKLAPDEKKLVLEAVKSFLAISAEETRELLDKGVEKKLTQFRQDLEGQRQKTEEWAMGLKPRKAERSAQDTKRLIAETLGWLSERKNIDKITVKELVETCGISRQTFYYHFQDILDVMEWTVQQELEKVTELSMKAEGPVEAIEVFVTFAEENKTRLQKLYDSQHRAKTEQIMIDAMKSYLQKMLEYRMGEMPISRDDMNAVLDFCSYGTAALLKDRTWKAQEEKQKLIRQLYWLIAGSITPFAGRNSTRTMEELEDDLRLRLTD